METARVSCPFILLPITNTLYHIHIMKKYIYILFVSVLCLASCDEATNEYDPYENWQARNATWFEDTVQLARQAIAKAKADYGEDEWQVHCQWRMYKSLLKTSASSGPVTDSICVRIISRGEDKDSKGSPSFTDSAYVNYRGWMMPVYNYNGNGSEMSMIQEMFDTACIIPTTLFIGTCETGSIPPHQEGWHAGEGTGDNERPAFPFQLQVRGEGPDRQALPSYGRHRLSFLCHCGPADFAG